MFDEKMSKEYLPYKLECFAELKKIGILDILFFMTSKQKSRYQQSVSAPFTHLRSHFF